MTPNEYAQLVKLATSRWKEEVRSGNLSPLNARRVKSYVGFDPQRHAEGLMTGAKARAKQLGYQVRLPMVKDIAHNYLGMVRRNSHAQREMQKQVDTLSSPKAIDAVRSKHDTIRKNMFADKPRGLTDMELGLSGGGGISMSSPRQVIVTPDTMGPATPLVLRHEVNEAAENALHKKKKIPTGYHQMPPKLERKATRAIGVGRNLYAASKGLTDLAAKQQTAKNPEYATKIFRTSDHVNATLPINDIRESRLLGGKGQRIMENMRKRTGELDELMAASQRVTGKAGYLPKHRIREIAAEMERANAARMRRMAVGEAGPVASRLLAGIRAAVPAARTAKKSIMYVKPSVLRGVSRIRRLLGR